MLSSYYFTGLGNNNDGYTLLSGNGLNVAYVFKERLGDFTLSNNQFINRNNSKLNLNYIFYLNDQTSGCFENTSAYISNQNINVNNIYESYIKYYSKNNTVIGLFNTQDILNTKTTISGLYKTSNKIFIDVTPHQQHNIILHTYDKALLVNEDLFKLEIVRSFSNNINEYLDQFNIPLSTALSDGHYSLWQNRTVRFPISNSGVLLPTSSVIYNVNSSETSKEYFGISAEIYEYDYYSFYEDVYYTNENMNYVFVSHEDSINKYENVLSGFSLKSPKYILKSDSYTNATLFKYENKYVPIDFTNKNILIDVNSNISIFGKFSIRDNTYIKKQNKFYWTTNFGYCFGDWIGTLSGLNYTSYGMENCVGYNLKVEEAPLSSYNYYPQLIGVRTLGGSEYNELDSNHYYQRSKVLDKLNETNENKLEIYIPLDPQSYSISL